MQSNQSDQSKNRGTLLHFFEITCVIIAAVKAGEGKTYRHPLSIRFIQTNEPENVSFLKKQPV